MDNDVRQDFMLIVDFFRQSVIGFKCLNFKSTTKILTLNFLKAQVFSQNMIACLSCNIRLDQVFLQKMELTFFACVNNYYQPFYC